MTKSATAKNWTLQVHPDGSARSYSPPPAPLTSEVSLGDQTFLIGVPATVPLTAPAGHDLPLYSDGTPLPGGVSISGASLVWSGAGAGGTTTDHVVRATPVVAQTGDLPTLVLSAAGAGTFPWSFGQVFKKSAVWPTNLRASAGVSAFQADVRNTWSDGSVKFAVLSGVSVFSGAPVTVVLATSGTGTTGADVPLSAAFTANPPQVVFTGGVTGTYTCPTTDTVTGWSRTSAHLVRKISGPVMTERHYYVPTADTHVMIWFHVRSYADGRTWVETIIENGWARISAPVERVYTCTVRINNAAVYGPTSMVHYQRIRWSRQDWYGGNPAITPSHNSAYLKATRMVPNYDTPAISSTYLNSLPQTPTPFNRHSYEINSDAGGAAPYLGLMPAWEAAYVQSGDARAYRAILANEQASNCLNADRYGGAGLRDESTGKPMRVVDLYSESLSNWFSPTYGGKVFNGTNSTVNGSTGRTDYYKNDLSHASLPGYMAYLVTGRWFSLETLLLQNAIWFAVNGVSSTSGPQPVRLGQDRAAAWDLRTQAAALAVIPSSETALAAGQASHLGTWLAYWAGNEIGANNLGIRKNIYNNTDYGPDPYNTAGAFQMAFVTQAFGFAWDLLEDVLATTPRANLQASVDFHCKYPAGMLGTRPDGFCYRRAGQYQLVVGPSRTRPLTSASFYSTFAEVYNTEVALGRIPTETCAVDGGSGTTLLYGSDNPLSITGTSYFGNLRPAAAYAVDRGVAGASAGWSRFTQSVSWSGFYANFATEPQFGISPRT